MKKIILKGEEATILFAKKVANKLKGGEIILLSGELGAGKTTFTRGLGEALGVKQVVNSPTFVLMKIYHANTSTINRLVHIDAYRLESGRDLMNIGALEYFGADKTVVVIEWPEKIEEILPKNVVNIKIINISEDDREFVVRNNKRLIY